MSINTLVPSAGIYKMPIMEYVNDPAPEPSFNSGMGKALLTQSPLHAKLSHPRLNPNYRGEHSSRMDLGTVAHAVLLEGDESGVELIDADDWRTKAAKEARDIARAAGKVPMLAKDMYTVRAMVKAAVDAIYVSELCEYWMEAIPEQSLIWQEGGTWCRSRPDKLTKNGRVYFDFKTTQDANPAKFVRNIINNGYDIQVALGIRGIKALIPDANPTAVFVCQEIEPPYAVSFVSLEPQFLSIANERLELALYRWRDCLQHKEWPGYPSRVCYVSAPGYYGNDSLPEES